MVGNVNGARRHGVAAGRGRTAVVTGANTGIGLASALRLAQEGFETVATVRSKEKAEDVYKAASEAGVAVETELLEVTDAAAGEALIERRRPYALVNNAGINDIAALEDTSVEDIRSMLEINTVAPIRLARAAVPHMRRDGGRIVNVSSAEGHIVLPLLGGYQISKHALEAATATMRLENAGDGIGVTSIAPGGVDTAIYSKGFWAEPDAHPGSRYRTGYRRIKQLMALNARVQLSSDDVAACVLEAILSPRPRPYYLVGADAHALFATHRLMPTRAREWLHRKAFGL